jgi:ABC-type nitrate/sulfonate/bicarbonate transport system permease component
MEESTKESTKESKQKAKHMSLAWTVAAFFILPAIWVMVKYLGHVSDRYLPSPIQVIQAVGDIEPNVAVHLAFTSLRLVAGFVAGLLVGIGLGVAAFKSQILARILAPVLDSMRSIPAIAIIPFFLLWFGFSEVGRILLVVTGIAFNIAIATYQILKEVPEKHQILFKSFNIAPSALTREYIIPRVLETLLPTVRFSLATAMGVVIASELLGSQIGLGYLMQTARNTFSMHVIFLCTILLGLLNAIVDSVVTRSWTRAVYWR